MKEKIYSGRHFGRNRCEAGSLPRHRHSFGYMCVVLSGRFVEAGDAGRFRVQPGDVLLHHPFEAHLDLLGDGDADLLNLPLPAGLDREGQAKVGDPDEIARLAEGDPVAAAEAVLGSLGECTAGGSDWPDLLAALLRGSAPVSVGDWARGHGLAPETVSRGFRQVFGTTAVRYRAECRARHAWRALVGGSRPLADLAFELGYADQPHMTRAVTQLTGAPPGRWRSSVKSVQDGLRRSA